MPSFDTPVPVGAFALILVAFAVKQLGADFLLQSSWMAQGKERASALARPALRPHRPARPRHAADRPDGRSRPCGGSRWPISRSTTVIDRGKALVGQRTHFPTTDARFWWLIGVDQFLHQVTHIGLAVVLAAA